MSIIRDRIKVIIFGTDTWGGKLFDVTLIFTIILSIVLVLTDSIKEYHQEYGEIFYVLELIITLFFTIEYFLRIYCIRRPASYIFSTGFAGFPGVKTSSIYGWSRFACQSLSCEPKEDLRLPFFRSEYRPHSRFCHVFDWRRSSRVYQHSPEYLLGDCYPHHGRLWGYFSHD